nr:interferon-induced, double-stranded RNA-activated protein kinase [Anolis sagrei ordinatus]
MAANNGNPHVYVARLHEYCQRNRLQLDYVELGVRGPPHDRIFTEAVQIDRRQYSPCEGKTKKEAKAHAAALAWETIESENKALEAQRQPQPAPLQLPAPLPAANITETSTNYISLLYEYASRNKKIIEFGLQSKDGPPHKPVFSHSCKIDGEILGVGTGSSKQMAKLNASKMAYEKLIGQVTARTENHDIPSVSTAYGSMSDSLGAPMVVTRRSLPEASGVASDSSEYVVFQNTNGAVLSSESNGTADKLASKLGGIHLDGSSPSSPDNPKGSATKLKSPPRLAPNFSVLPQRESRYTVNKRFLDEFTDIEKLDSGGYGSVFKAKHKIDNKIYAVKRVKLIEVNEENTKKEVLALANLVHENIVQYFGCWIGKDTWPSEESNSDVSSGHARLHDCLFIRMDYCEKGTLKKWMQQDGGKESYYEDVLLKFQQIVNGVEFIHKKNYIHRDLKPLNIFISGDNKIKIGDFGLVTTGIDEQHTQCKGTKLYMAPEQVWRNYGKEVDIFSLGLILLEMLSTFQTDHEKTKVIWEAKEGKLPEAFMKKFPREARLIKILLSKEPSQRPTAKDILNILKLDGPHTC